MQRTDPNYRLEIIPRWARMNMATEVCPVCNGNPRARSFRMFEYEEEEQRKPCEGCNDNGRRLIKLPPPPEIEKAFIWHMQNAYHEFWDKQEAIQAAYALKVAIDDSANSASL